MKINLLALAISLLLPGMAIAGGYQVNLMGQRHIGMGHTGTGLAMGNASLFFNPGAMSHLRENGVTIGASGLVSKIAFRASEPGNATYQTNNSLGTPFQAYGVFGNEGSPVKFGLGIYTPYGSSVKWGEQWQGRYSLSEIDLSAVFIQPTISYRISENLGIGGGITYVLGQVNLQRMLPLQDQNGQEARAAFKGRASGLGFNVGVYFEPTDMFSFGLTYRSRVNLNVKEGDATFRVPTSVNMLDPGRFPNTTFSATLPLPDNITVGVGFKPTAALTIAIDVQRVGWSAYDSLIFEFNERVNNETSSRSGRNYQDAYIYRLGAEYKLTDAVVVRAGTYFDNTPVPAGYLTPESPDANALGISAGFSYSLTDKLGLDASFLYINKKKRTDAADLSNGTAGTFKSVAYIPGVALNYSF